MNFTIDNTEGFTDQELYEMNRAYENEVLSLGPESDLFLDQCQAIEERICNAMSTARALSESALILSAHEIFRLTYSKEN